MTMKISTDCALCQSPAHGLLFRMDEEEIYFCCKGCQVVYQILKAQGALEGFKEHPVYRQALQAGLITNPHLLFSKEEERSLPDNEFQRLHLSIQNMWCPSCAQVIHLILMKEKGIRHCAVDYSTDLASIEYTPRLISREKLLRCIERLGYQPSFLKDARQTAVSRSLMLKFIVAAFFSLNVMMFAYPIYATYFDHGVGEDYARLFAWLSLGGAIPVLFYSALPIWRRCYFGLKVGVWGMEVLVCMGIAAAAGLSLYELFHDSPYVYFDSITVIIMFVLLGKMIESKAKFSAKDALVNLSLAMPRKGRKRFSEGKEVFVPIKEISPGDLLVVRMGEKIVLDGTVAEGSGACDESLMTGESTPLVKHIGATVLAGTFVQQGCMVIKVTSSLEETTLQKIIDMVAQDIDHKSKYLRAADEIVKWFVPFVVCLSLMTGIFCYFFDVRDGDQSSLQTAIIRSISVLLISCPCAIGIAAPLAESYLLNALAKLGILVRNRGCLPFLGNETAFVFDKTGTLTEGQFNVCEGLDCLTFDEKKILKGLVAHSIHPVAAAINAALLSPALSFEKIEERVGKGLQGTFQGKQYYLGSPFFLKEQGIDLLLAEDSDSSKILTTVYFADEEKCLTLIVLGDRLREGMKEFISQLSPMKTLLISGDGEKPVHAVAQACQIQQWKWGCDPMQKKNWIEELRKNGETVAMLGDGMNDAPALAAAHVGIAVFSATEMSIQVSDLLLTTNHYPSLVQMRQIAMKGRKIINQNLFWAFFYNCIGLGVAALGYLTPLFAAIAMVMSSMIVLLNAQRLSKK